MQGPRDAQGNDGDMMVSSVLEMLGESVVIVRFGMRKEIYGVWVSRVAARTLDLLLFVCNSDSWKFVRVGL